jgi:hypothetical protein
MHQVGGFMISGTGIQAVQSVFLMLLVFAAMFAGLARRVKVPFDVAKDGGLPNRDDIVVAHTWWFNIFGLATLMVIQGVMPDLPDQALVVEQTIATLWAGVQAVPRLPKSAISKRSGRSSASKHYKDSIM